MYTESNLLKQVRQFALIARRYRKTYAPGVMEFVKLRWKALIDSGVVGEGLIVQRERLAAMVVREYTVYDADRAPSYEAVIEALPLPDEQE